MDIKKDIFKSYDIRGIYPGELNEEIAYLVGKSFAELTKANTIAIAKDGRLSSDSLFNSLKKGIIEYGTNIIDFGSIPTECLYFSVGFYKIDAGIMTTASHNPKEYNGFKMIKLNNDAVDMITGKDIKEVVEKTDSSKRGKDKPGAAKEGEIIKNYLSHIFSLVDTSKIKPLKIVIDASSGMASKLYIDILKKLPVESIFLNFDVDGNFPSHSPNPALEGSADQISKKIIEEKADLGIILDGDGDRIFLLNEKGELLPPDITFLLFIKYFLEKNPGSAISYNAVCSKAVPQYIEKLGGRPLRAKVGFVNVREAIIKNDGIMGGELSGHYCFKDNFYLDSSAIPFLILLNIISNSNKKVSELFSGLYKFYKDPAWEFKANNQENIINLLKDKYKDGAQDFLDGITVEYKDWWFNVRGSQTEPIMRLTIEADSKELLEKNKKELMNIISNN